MASLLDIRGVSKQFILERGLSRRASGSVQALKKVSFSIDAGEAVALVGGSGSGKSTMAKICAGLYTPDEGEILWRGRSLPTYTREERAGFIQMIFQDPYASLNPKLSIGTQLQEVLHGRSSGAELLERVGLTPDAMTHYPFQFSGGQRQRIAIARALALNPALLVADEPLSSLDVTTQAKILELFQTLRKSSGLSILLITHDLAVAYGFADRIIVLQSGEVVEEGRSLDVLERPTHAYTRSLIQAVPHLPC